MSGNKKKNPPNAFSFYLDDAVVELRKKGMKISSKFEAVPHVHDKWKYMSEEERARYEKKAKLWKMNKGQRPGKKDNYGCLISERIDLKAVIRENRREQMKILQDNWNGLDVEQQSFYFISFQSYFEFPDEEGYQPCEVACIEYSLTQGISREWHALINPGPIVRGMGAESKIWSEKTHKIPIWGFEAGRTDYYNVWRELIEFVNPGIKRKVLPLVFSLISELRKNEFCLREMSRLAGVMNQLRVFQWESLVLAMYARARVQPPSMNMIDMGATSSMYDYEVNTKCDYHYEIECTYCSLLTIKKCAFWMSDALSSVYKFEITERHLPVKQPIECTIINPEDLSFPDYTKKYLRSFDNVDNLTSSSRDSEENNSYNDDENEKYPYEKFFGARDIRFRPKFQLYDRKPRSRGLTVARRVTEPYTEEMWERDFNEGKFLQDSSRFSDTDSVSTLKSEKSTDNQCSSTDYLLAAANAAAVEEREMLRGEKRRINSYLEENFPAPDNLVAMSIMKEGAFTPAHGRGRSFCEKR